MVSSNEDGWKEPPICRIVWDLWTLGEIFSVTKSDGSSKLSVCLWPVQLTTSRRDRVLVRHLWPSTSPKRRRIYCYVSEFFLFLCPFVLGLFPYFILRFLVGLTFIYLMNCLLNFVCQYRNIYYFTSCTSPLVMCFILKVVSLLKFHFVHLWNFDFLYYLIF